MKHGLITGILLLCASVAFATPGTFKIAGTVTAVHFSADATVLEIDGGSFNLLCASYPWCDRFQAGDTAIFYGALPQSDSDGILVIQGFSVALGNDNGNQADEDGDPPIDADGDGGDAEPTEVGGGDDEPTLDDGRGR